MIMNTIGRNFVVPFDPTNQSPQTNYRLMYQEVGASGIIDLVVLGCGEDGHTASLFPNTPLLNEKSSSFMKNKLPSGQLRYSMTFSVINNATRRVVFVNDNSEKIKYFRSDSIKSRAYPIHQVLSILNTKVILHEAI